MAIHENPFTPSFGEAPLFMGGREQFLSIYAREVERQNRAPELTTLISGVRGSSKTSLMLRMAEEASASGWIAARPTCLSGMLEDIYVQVLEASSNVMGAVSSRRLTSRGVGSLASLGWETQHDASSTWRARMAAILETLADIVVCSRWE